MSGTLRIGIVGTGNIAAVNVQALLATGRAEIAALCNHRLEKAQLFGAALAQAARIFRDSGEMLRSVPLDAVLLCTPQDVHCDDFLRCAEAGIHVLVEKPLALNVAQGEAMIAARDQYGIRAAVCHTQRYRAPVIALKQLLDSGELGQVISVLDVVDMHYFRPERPAWCSSAARTGGAILYTHGSHQFDRLMYLLDDTPDWLDAHLEAASDHLEEACPPDLDSGYHILGQMGGRAFVIDCGGYSMPILSGMMVRCTRGTARMCLKETGVDHPGVYVSRNGSAYESLPLPCRDEDTYVRQMHDLLDALEGREHHAPMLEHGLRVMRCLEAAKQASRMACRIAL